MSAPSATPGVQPPTAPLTDHERQLLGATNLLYVATLGADGSPQVSPVWAEAEGDLIVINTARGRIKERNIRRDPRVAVSMHSRDDLYDKFAFKGRVVKITETGADSHIDKLSRKYRGTDFPWHEPGEQRVIMKIAKLAPKSAA
jgi:PPOX class probable F420-dependent enzyme